MRKLGDFYILTLEPLQGRDIINKAFKEIKGDFPGAFISTTSKDEIEIETEVSTEVSHVDIEESQEDEKMLEKSAELEKSSDAIEVEESFSVEVVDEKLQNIAKQENISKVSNEKKEVVKKDTNVPEPKKDLQTPILVDNKDITDSTDIEEYKPLTKSSMKVIKTELEEKFNQATNHWLLKELPSYLGYLFLIALLSAGAYYFVKFKKVYDEY